MTDEKREEERRYEESAEEGVKVLDSRVLADPVPVLQPRAVVTVQNDVTVADVVARMADKKSGCAVILDGKQLAGIFTERDALRRVLAAGLDPAATPITDVMTADPERVAVTDTLGFALHKMSVGSFRHLPLVDAQGLPAGVVTQEEAVRYLVGFFPEEVINQPPRSVHTNPHDSQYGG